MNRKTTSRKIPNGKVAVFFIGAIAFCLALQVQASAKSKVNSIAQVRKVYVRGLTGDAVFTSRLKNEMRKMGLQFVTQKSSADAILSGSGEYSDGEFYGQIKFYNQSGKLIWQAKAFRPRNSNYMAYSRLADQLRRELKRRNVGCRR